MTEDQNALLIFAEELGEVAAELLALQKLVSKAIRFGIDERRPDLLCTNRERIKAEWQDLLGCAKVLQSRGLVDLSPDAEAIAAKVEKIRRYTDYSIQQGQVSALGATGSEG